MKIIDAHCHVYPTAIAAKAVNNIGHFYDINMYGAGTAEDLLKTGSNARRDSIPYFFRSDHAAPNQLY